MEKIDFVKLLTYKNGKLMVEGFDLVELANMYSCSADVFLEVISQYLEYYNNRFDRIMKVKGKNELLVNSKKYEIMKKKIFDLAYTKFSEFGILECEAFISFTKRGKLVNYLNRNNNYYSCIYQSILHGNYLVEKISSVMIDKSDQENKYEYLKRR